MFGMIVTKTSHNEGHLIYDFAYDKLAIDVLKKRVPYYARWFNSGYKRWVIAAPFEEVTDDLFMELYGDQCLYDRTTLTPNYERVAVTATIDRFSVFRQHEGENWRSSISYTQDRQGYVVHENVVRRYYGMPTVHFEPLVTATIDTSTPYTTLNVDPNADKAEIKKAYRQLVKAYHPDVYDGDEQHILEINDAYEILSNPSKKAKYDMLAQIIPQKDSVKKAKRESVVIDREWKCPFAGGRIGGWAHRYPPNVYWITEMLIMDNIPPSPWR